MCLWWKFVGILYSFTGWSYLRDSLSPPDDEYLSNPMKLSENTELLKEKEEEENLWLHQIKLSEQKINKYYRVSPLFSKFNLLSICQNIRKTN